MKATEIVNNNMNQMPEQIASDKLKIISTLNKSANILWEECYYDDLEVYWTEAKDYNIYLLFQLDTESNDFDLYMEDKDVNSYYCFSGKIWRDQLLDIYNNMNVIQYESDSEPFKFVEDVNYDSEIKGEIKKIIKLNINYNQEILGMV